MHTADLRCRLQSKDDAVLESAFWELVGQEPAFRHSVPNRTAGDPVGGRKIMDSGVLGARCQMRG